MHGAEGFTWPNITISDCKFHLYEVWYSKIRSLGQTSGFGNWEVAQSYLWIDLPKHMGSW